MASLVAQTVKNPPAMQETQVQSLGQDYPLEKEMANWYSCLENPMNRGACWATVRGIAESDMMEQLTIQNINHSDGKAPYLFFKNDNTHMKIQPISDKSFHLDMSLY